MNNTLDTKTLGNWLWEGACKIRGEIDAPKYKDYILPLIFLKRLKDIFANEVVSFAQEIADKKRAENLIVKNHSLVSFYLPEETRRSEIVKQTTNVHDMKKEIPMGYIIRPASLSEDSPLQKFDIVVIKICRVVP